MPLTEIVVLVAAVGVLVIGVASFFARRIGIAAPLVLVVIGVGLGAIPGASDAAASVDPELILTVVLPPLLFAAARQVPIVDFRRNLRVILLLAIVLVVVSAVLVGVLVHLVWATVPLALAIALGAVVAPPDAVAATSLGKRIGLPPRIVTILEGEGLINDATALVLLSTALGIATATSETTGGGVALSFVWSILGATAIGWIAGFASVQIRKRVTDPTLDASISIVLPFLVYLGAEAVGSSGVVAVVAAGIMVGNGGAFRIPAAARRTESSTWQLSTMLLENAVFLYMGIELWPIVGTVASGEGSLPAVVGMALLVTALLVGLRYAAMPPLLWWIRHRYRRASVRFESGKERMEVAGERFGDNPEPRVQTRIDHFRTWLERTENDLGAERDQALGWRDGVILGMSGMRGVVTVAAAQTLPEDDPNRAALVLVAYAVAVITLLAQGLALPAVVRRLRPAEDVDGAQRRETADLRARIQSAGDEEVARQLDSRDDVPQKVKDEVRSSADTRARQWEEWGSEDRTDPHGNVAIFLDIMRIQLDAQRAALREERAKGAYSSEAIGFVGAALDSIELQIGAFAADPD